MAMGCLRGVVGSLLLLVVGAQGQHDACASLGSPEMCHYSIECRWCARSDGVGRCANYTSKALAGETCDPLVGCGGHRTNASCDSDSKCKWCTSFEQGWPLCAEASKDLSGAAKCDKTTPPVSASQEDEACASLGSPEMCHYNIECRWCARSDGVGRCANYTSKALAGETCDPLVGCGGHRTNASCDSDSKCKWCTSFEQGWPFCAEVSKDLSGGAKCDKAPQFII